MRIKKQTQIKKNGLIIRLAIIVIALAALVILPNFLSATRMTMISRIMVFSVYAMAYDILRGYTGFIHLGFALFIGGGAYFVGILFVRVATSWPMLLLAILGTVVYSIFWALLVGKVAASGGSVLATAMITMAFGEIMRNMMERWRTVTNGADGLNYKTPFPFSNRTFMYYLCFAFMVVMLVVLFRFINSPTGRVLQGIRENEQRAVFLGYNTNRARTIALLVAGIAAGLSGIVYGLLNRFVNTDLLNMQMTYNAMLYSLIGGTGTLYGSIVGSTVVIFFQDLLLNLRSLHPIFERWLLFFGALYIAVIMYMPQGIVGFYNSWKEKRMHKKMAQGAVVSQEKQ
ncbi:branched-chain amino acid ABC transporter permease [Ruminococcaceae bacterium OttesenSCG-928-A16]|nr:branched-chain amino acid ABC transporter permease [Ruminococcaceae bacterium OttesenSCG-928-A16]